MPNFDETTGRGSTTNLGSPPEAWGPAHAAVQRALAPVERFLRIEASSGLLLLAAAVIALAVANSPWRAVYESVLHTPIGVSIGGLGFERDVHFWINDGLMTIFFFVVGLEIRRELHHGELSELRRAALPVVTAIGGMLVPAALYATFNAGRPSAGGWGVPMATDIAFAVGVLALLGNRVPPALRILLLALAVIDDVGAILVIAVFYSGGLEPSGFAILGAGVGGILLFQKAGLRSPWLFVAPAVAVWAGAYTAGIHPTLAGVIVGLLTPVRAWFGPAGFVDRVAESVDQLRREPPVAETRLLPHLDALGLAKREAVSPVERLQHALHGWVAFGIMPLFALANAGVPVTNLDLDGEVLWPFLGILLGLAVGKPLGIFLLARVSVSLGIANLPRGVTWPQIALVGVVAGIGFTMSLFIADLAFDSGAQLETAKLAVLVASGAAACTGLALGARILPHACPVEAAQTLEEAERSTSA